MVEINQMVPIKYDKRVDVIRECVKLYFREMWIQDMDKNFKDGYEKMSKINLGLAEIGLKEDMSDLCDYESMLIGREKL